jgi:hypothetical protein
MPDPRFTALADALIPGQAEADGTGKWIDRALAAADLLNRMDPATPMRVRRVPWWF